MSQAMVNGSQDEQGKAAWLREFKSYQERLGKAHAEANQGPRTAAEVAEVWLSIGEAIHRLASRGAGRPDGQVIDLAEALEAAGDELREADEGDTAENPLGGMIAEVCRDGEALGIVAGEAPAVM